jgi:hypothetical protein
MTFDNSRAGWRLDVSPPIRNLNQARPPIRMSARAEESARWRDPFSKDNTDSTTAAAMARLASARPFRARRPVARRAIRRRARGVLRLSDRLVHRIAITAAVVAPAAPIASADGST